METAGIMRTDARCIRATSIPKASLDFRKFINDLAVLVELDIKTDHVRYWRVSCPESV